MNRFWKPKTTFPPEARTAEGFGTGLSVVVYGIEKNEKDNQVMLVCYDYRHSVWIVNGQERTEVKVEEWMPQKEYEELNSFVGSVYSTHWCRLFCPQHKNCGNQVGNEQPTHLVAPCEWES